MTAAANAMSVGTGKTNSPILTDSVAYGLTSALIRRKSSVQMLLADWIMMTRTPKLKRSELSSLMASRSYAHWRSAPATNSTGAVTKIVRSGSSPHDVAVW